MRHTFRTLVICVVVLLICGAAIFPPREKLRLGRDLAGGATLVYSVDLSANESSDVIDSIIDVLKKRVDPQGVMEIAFTRQGRDRIEVSMPLPTDQVKALKAQYRALLDAVGSKAIDSSELDRILRMAPDQRRAEFSRLAGGNEKRLETLMKAAGAADAAQQARAAYDEAVANQAPQEQVDKFLAAAGDAAVTYDEARRVALSMNVSKPELEQALQLSNDQRRIRDDRTNKVEVLPSPRALAIERMKKDHPEAAGEIEQVVSAYDVFVSKRAGLDDPQDLKRLLRGAGVLNFRIAVRPHAHQAEERLRRELAQNGPRGVQATDARWFPIHDITTWYRNKQELESLEANARAFFENRRFVGAERDGVYYMLLYDRPGSMITQADGKWAVSAAYKGIDPLGQPAIDFEMDPNGARLLGSLTEKNIGEPMAVLLDDKVYTAPNLQSPISSRGQIVGTFPPAEITYLVRTLGAGSLQAKLSPEPISEDVLGPELGADNLRYGLHAGLVSLIVISGFMIVYYFGAGFVAVIALFANSIVILGLMSLNRAAFTLPGIAGVILTFGMAVDSNVLIYERIREELQHGRDLKTAVRHGFDRVFSTIVDGHVTIMIACVVLYYTATQELKGFAVTMGIGVVGTLFAALMVSRLIFTFLVETLKVKEMLQLPMVIPALQRAMTPHVDWLRLRPLFWTFSGAFCAFGVYMVVANGESMLGNEFRGGTSVTITLREDLDGPGPKDPQPLFKTRQEIEDRVDAATKSAPAGSPGYEVARGEILAINPQADGVTSDQFRIKTVSTDGVGVQRVVTGALQDWTLTQPPLRFTGWESATSVGAPVYRILDSSLGANIGRPAIRNDVSKFVGGVAVLLEGFEEPLPSKESLEARLRQMRDSPEFAELANWPTEFIVIEEGPNHGVRSAAVVALNDRVTMFDDEKIWRSDVAEKEWKVVRDAMTTSTSLASLQTFSPQIAKSFKAQAIVAVVLTLLAITIYIWVRFGSVRYSIAAMVSLLHDILATLAFVALSGIIYQKFPSVAAALLITPARIDLGLIAALLTIVGYSLNDTIVVMDRVRENRGKLGYASAEVVNASINQTMSRTIITTGTTVLAIFILYATGGSGVHPFAFALFVGVISGSYSTVAIASPLLYSHREAKAGGQRHRPVGSVAEKEALAVT